MFMNGGTCCIQVMYVREKQRNKDIEDNSNIFKKKFYFHCFSLCGGIPAQGIQDTLDVFL